MELKLYKIHYFPDIYNNPIILPSKIHLTSTVLIRWNFFFSK